jgi:hypothetical protein
MKHRMNTLTLNTLLLLGCTASLPLYATSSTPSTPTVYSGTNQETSKAALAAFQEAVGGSNASKITWDGVKLDGTDINPNTKIIDFGKTVEIPVDRFKGAGAIFADPYTVSGDGFASINPHTAQDFIAFSPKNTFAMFDPESGKFADRFIQQTFVLNGTDTTAGTRGFGAIFTDVELQNSSSIEYFGTDDYGNKVSLGKFAVPTGKSGDSQFVGVVFDAPIITEVSLTLGSNALFSFDGQHTQAFGGENFEYGIDLVVTDDFMFAKPEAAHTINAKNYCPNNI